jgi:GAF domain-containing protein
MPLFKRRTKAASPQPDEVQVLQNLDRVNAVYATGLLDAPARPELDAITKDAAEQLETPIALMTFIDDHRQYFVGRYDRDGEPAAPRETSLDVSYCKYVVMRDAPLEVSDATDDPLVEDNPATVEDGVRSYLGVPLRTAGGDVLGSFCVVDHRPRHWTDANRRELQALADSAMELTRIQA